MLSMCFLKSLHRFSYIGYALDVNISSNANKYSVLTLGRRSKKVVLGVALERTAAALTSDPSSSSTPLMALPLPTRILATG